MHIASYLLQKTAFEFSVLASSENSPYKNCKGCFHPCGHLNLRFMNGYNEYS